MADRHLWEIRPLRDVLAVLVVALLLWLGYAFRDVTVPLLVALLLAYLFEPVVAWMARTRWIPFGRTGAVSLLLASIVVGAIAGAAIIVPEVVTQSSNLVETIEDGSARTKLMRLNTLYVPKDLQDDVDRLLQRLPQGDGVVEGVDVGEVDARSAAAATDATVHNASDIDAAGTESSTDPLEGSASLSDRLAAQSSSVDLLGFAGRTGRIALSVASNVLAVGLLLFLIPFYFFFFSLWYPDVAKFVESMIPDRSRSTVAPLLTQFDRAIAGFVRGRLFIAFIMGVLFALGWGLIGVPYAILLSVVTAVLCLVPFVSGIALPVAIALLAAAELDLPVDERMSWWAILLWPSVVFAIVQLLDGWVLQPIIYGKTTDLDPVTIFVAILAGGSVLGIYGMLIAIPVAACVKILLKEVIVPKLRDLGQRPVH